MGRSSKGSAFERNFSRRLSMWWTDGEHDDWFWRSHGSGARATQRAQHGQETTGYAGDITATHSDAYPLLEFMSFELKCGYPKVHVADVFDAISNAKPKWIEFYFQGMDAANQNESLGHALVTQRTRHEPMMWMPVRLEELLRKTLVPPFPIQFDIPFHLLPEIPDIVTVSGCTVDWWFDNVTPDDVKDALDHA